MRYPILLPTSPALRTPDEVYLRTPSPGGAVTLVYRARRDLFYRQRAGRAGR